MVTPKHGLIQPGEFISIAEESDLIIDIDLWVLEAACKQFQIWKTKHLISPGLQLSINFSSRQFNQVNLLNRIDEILAKTGMSPRQLQFEITESTLLNQSEQVRNIINGLKERGIQLHIDDFGTGYSSLQYLQNFPVDALKIDRSFVDNLLKNHESIELVRTIILMARNLGMKVVAEGWRMRLARAPPQPSMWLSTRLPLCQTHDS
ncbi:MAG: EAL domain-containing protein [Deinococcales bacterium]